MQGHPRQLSPGLSVTRAILSQGRASRDSWAGALPTWAWAAPRQTATPLSSTSGGVRRLSSAAENPSPGPPRPLPGVGASVPPGERVPGTQGARSAPGLPRCPRERPRFPGEEREERRGSATSLESGRAPGPSGPGLGQPRAPGGGYLWRRRRPPARACRGSPSAPSPACPGSAGACPTRRKPRAPRAMRGCSSLRVRR